MSARKLRCPAIRGPVPARGHFVDIVIFWIMLGSRFHFGRRRRPPASVGAVVLFLGLFVGWDYVQGELQRGEEYSGAIVRVYEERSFPGSRSFHHYWDIRATDGEIHAARIRSRQHWNTGHSGLRVTKRAGELYPVIMGN